jgi:hypothetical protein
MASNLECTILEGESINPDNPNPWQVTMQFFDQNHELVRQWAVDAPSELVAKSIQAGLQSLSSVDYDNLYSEVTVH